MTRSRPWLCCCNALLLAVICFLGLGFSVYAETATTETNGAKLNDEQLGELLQATVLMEQMGLYDEAEKRCFQILEQKPDDPTVKQLLDEIQQQKSRQNGASALKTRLLQTIIPELNVRDAAVSDVIDFLQAEGQKRSKDQSPINIVWQTPESAKTTKITLSLRQVPLADMLKYATESVGLRYRVDAHAVVIYQAPPTAPKDAGAANVKSP